MGDFIQSVVEKLKRHPKRLVFTDGANIRVLRVAEEYVNLGLGTVVVLGNRDEVHRMTGEAGIDLKKVNVIDPKSADDLPMFVDHLRENIRYKNMGYDEAVETMNQPNYFAAMMVKYGQCDGLIAGSGPGSGNLFRPLFQLVKPLPGVNLISGCVVMEVPNCAYGHEGTFFFADTGVNPKPSEEQLGNIAVETARLMRQLTGCLPRVAFLSYSTKGSACTEDTERIVRAMEIAQKKAEEQNVDARFDGEFQVGAAITPEIADVRELPGEVAGRANVLIFPDLNASNISVNLVQRLAKARIYGQILVGLEKPAAQFSPAATASDILGIAAIVGLQAVGYHQLYPPSEE